MRPCLPDKHASPQCNLTHLRHKPGTLKEPCPGWAVFGKRSMQCVSVHTCDVVLADVEVGEVGQIPVLSWQGATQGVCRAVQKRKRRQLAP